MRRRKLILLSMLMAVVPVLLSGCYLWPRYAILRLGFSPNWVPLNTPVLVTETLREVNGVGVHLNYFKEEWIDEWGVITGGWEWKDAAAEFAFQTIFGTSYIPGYGELVYSSTCSSSQPQKWVRTYGGRDHNGNTVIASAEILFGM